MDAVGKILTLKYLEMCLSYDLIVWQYSQLLSI
jgi:hypothetical protein